MTKYLVPTTKNFELTHSSKQLLPLISYESLPNTLQRVFSLLTKSERRRAGILLLTILVNSIVEILGLAVVVPVIGLVVRPETIQQQTYLSRAYDLAHHLGVQNSDQFLLLLCAFMVSAFLFKAGFGLMTSHFQSRFSFAVAHRLGGMMWTHHFSQSLEELRSSDSGRILAEINAWPIYFANSFMIGSLMILSECTVIVIISTGLFLYDPMVFGGIATLLVLGSFIIRAFTKNKLAHFSQMRQKLEPQNNTLITNSIRGFLEVVTFQASDAVRNRYLHDRATVFDIHSKTTVLNVAPAKLYEVLAVVAVAGAIVFAILLGTPQSNFLQLLSFMAISAYRIMPSMSRLNGAVIQMRSNAHVLADLEEVTRHSSNNEGPALPVLQFESGLDIRLQNVSLGYSSLEHNVIDRLSHTMNHGQIHAVVGASGSGKSTLINAILALHKPTEGTISVHAADEQLPARELWKDLHVGEWISQFGYLSQQPFLFQGSVEENLTLNVPNAPVNRELVSELIDKLDLRDSLGTDHMAFNLHEGGTNLSGGQQQRLALVRALQVDRPILVLDEATSALDKRLRDVVFGLLQKRAADGCNVILITHDSELAARCDTRLILDKAKA